MSKLALTIILIITALLGTGCTQGKPKESTSIIVDNSQNIEDSSIDNKELNYNMVKIPVEVMSKYEKEETYINVKSTASLEEKVDLILKTISKESFNGLTIKATIYGEDTSKIEAKVELIESEQSKNRITWKDDYLNSKNKEKTINNIVKNLLQSEYKGPWIKTVQLYYDDELVTLD